MSRSYLPFKELIPQALANWGTGVVKVHLPGAVN